MPDGYSSKRIERLLPEGFALRMPGEVGAPYNAVLPDGLTGRRVVCFGKVAVGFIAGNGKKTYVTLPALDELRGEERDKCNEFSNKLRANHEVSTVKPLEALYA